jgi:hypothetical protein
MQRMARGRSHAAEENRKIRAGMKYQIEKRF